MPKLSDTRLTKRVIDAVEAAPVVKYLWDCEVRGFGLRVTPAGLKSYVYRYKVKSPKVQRIDVIAPAGKGSSMTVEQARDEARKLAAQRGVDHKGLREQEAEKLKRAKTMADLQTLYLDDYAVTRGLRPNTLSASRVGFALIPDAFKGLLVEAVTKPDIRHLHGLARDKAGKYQANRLLALLSKVFSLAEELGWRTSPNPCRGITKYPEDQRWRNLSELEVARLLKACRAYDADEDTAKYVGDAIRLLLYTGARLQEVLKAEWSMFDLDRALWEKPSAHTKTKLQHRLVLPEDAMTVLRQMRTRDEHGLFLFPGTPIISPNGEATERPRSDLKRAWAWIKKEAGLQDVRLHDLRRTTASFMLSDGATLASVGKTLGHTQAATTQRYAHLAGSVQAADLEKSSRRMAKLEEMTLSP